ncbi:MAG: ABC transporter substrate-binding protein [Kiloniellales bacterium]
MAPPRIVSLLPSATETVAALGLADALVGRSHECDPPFGGAEVPALTAPRFPADRPSAEIDRDVRAIVEQGLAVYRVDAEALRELRPDVILTQDQCKVCSLSTAQLEAAVADWVEGRPRVVSAHGATLAEVWQDMRDVAEALGVAERGAALVAELEGRVEAIAARARAEPRRPRLAAIEWIEPLMGSGNWMPELIALAGGVSLFGKIGEPSPRIDREALGRADPEVILVSPCGFSIAQSRADMPVLADWPGWARLSAVAAGRVCIADGNRYFHRPGPSLGESLEILAEITHPDAFDFGHRDRDWVRWDG